MYRCGTYKNDVIVLGEKKPYTSPNAVNPRNHQHSLAADEEAIAAAGNSPTEAELTGCSIELQ